MLIKIKDDKVHSQQQCIYFEADEGVSIIKQ